VKFESASCQKSQILNPKLKRCSRVDHHW
jgi:hypothetical protein